MAGTYTEYAELLDAVFRKRVTADMVEKWTEATINRLELTPSADLWRMLVQAKTLAASESGGSFALAEPFDV